MKLFHYIRKSVGFVSWFKKFSFMVSHFARQEKRIKSFASDGLTELDKAFRKNGCAVTISPLSVYENLLTLSHPYFDRLASDRKRSSDIGRAFERSRSYARRDESSALFECIERVFEEAGVLDTASGYLGRQAKLVDVNPQINDSSDDFWRREFPDIEGGLPPCAYFHRDASGGDIKVIMYMTDVGIDNGPFSYVLGSHTMPLNKFYDHVSEANDSNGLSSTDPKSRKAFSSLPSPLRHKGSFGNDILDDSELSKLIKDSTWQITAQKGAILMFDTKGIHRGGMVITGERRVITCVIS